MRKRAPFSKQLTLARGRAMVSGFEKGARFRTHYDNPNRNGRVLTFVYYLNDGWDAGRDGGEGGRGCGHRSRLWRTSRTALAVKKPAVDRHSDVWLRQRQQQRFGDFAS